MVFFSAGSLVLVAIATLDHHPSFSPSHYPYFETEGYLRMQLEHAYGQILSALTSHVQTYLSRDPNADLRSMLGRSTDTAMRRALDRVGMEGDGCGGFLTGGVEAVAGVPHRVRNRASLVLTGACDPDPSTVFAVLSYGRRIVSLIQPCDPRHRLCYSDLTMLLDVVVDSHSVRRGGDGGGGMDTELWFPVCLPRLNPTGFVYAYHRSRYIDGGCSDEGDGRTRKRLDLTLVSQESSTDRFKSLRKTAGVIWTGLGMEEEEGEEGNGGGRGGGGSVLRIYDLRGKKEGRMCNPGGEAVEGRDEDVDLLWERIGAERGTTRKDPSVRSGTAEDLSVRNPAGGRPRTIVEHVSAALAPGNYSNITAGYLRTSGALHFLFRLTVPIRHYRTDDRTGGTFTQCLNTPILPPFHTPSAKNRLWSTYQKLCLRLRLGSASVGTSMDAYDETAAPNDGPASPPTDYPASRLHETSPPPRRLAYVVEDGDMFVGTSGEGYELYAVLPAEMGAVEATDRCRKLVSALEGDSETLFLAEPSAF